jgi:radical SAM-linked protein
MWVRVRYTKTGPASYASNRDLARAFERMVRRAQVPVAYSSGFSPHPRISHYNVAPTGAASLAEYLEVALAAAPDLEQLREALHTVAPVGVAVTEVVAIQRGATAKELTASLWRAEFSAPIGLEAAVQALLAAPAATITRESGSGIKTIDVVPALRELRVDGNIVTMVVAHTEPLVRASDVTAALSRYGADWSSCRLTRLEQGSATAF